ncbi:HU family DNA-binding protein [Paraburkholderia sp. CNPSo 3274]|uniref:HU family DNA-binding protein n=1 Tax=Paraburkholderia sp. CNPSo 3274 TaxID=2940932 RepID=UPI0035CD053F
MSEAVRLSGFGVFRLRDKSPRPGRNPQTGVAAHYAARRVVKFHASALLRAHVERDDDAVERINKAFHRVGY